LLEGKIKLGGELTAVLKGDLKLRERDCHDETDGQILALLNAAKPRSEVGREVRVTSCVIRRAIERSMYGRLRRAPT
jgi:hypothetical protein